MAKLKKGRVKIHICETCHGNGNVRVAKIKEIGPEKIDDNLIHIKFYCSPVQET